MIVIWQMIRTQDTVSMDISFSFCEIPVACKSKIMKSIVLSTTEAE